MVGYDVVWFSIQEGRGSEEAKKAPEYFEGLVTSDSRSTWNHADTERQKCHLHYRSDLKKTMRENRNPEFQVVANKLMWDSHGREKGYDPDDDLQTIPL